MIATKSDYSTIFSVEDYLFRLSPKDNDRVNDRIKVFGAALSEKLQSADFYAENRDTTPEKAALDIITGKKAEVAVMLVLRNHFGFPVVDIDMEIRVGKGKGWKPDLAYREVNPEICNVHVKSCTSWTHRRFGDYTWTFQKTDEIFEKGDGDLIALVHMDDWWEPECVLKVVAPWDLARKRLRPPQLPKHRRGKTCLYYKDFA